MSKLIDKRTEGKAMIMDRCVSGLNNANQFLISEARADAPVQSGRLRKGIEVVQEATTHNPVAIGAAKEPYSNEVNRGTSDTEAKPFWTNSWLRMKNQFGGFFR